MHIFIISDYELFISVVYSHTRYETLGSQLIPVYMQAVNLQVTFQSSWRCYDYFPPNLRLPAQPKTSTKLYCLVTYMGK